MKTNETIIISETGEVHGYGSDPYKWVSHLTAEERAAVRAGQVVLVRAGRKSSRAASGTYWRQAVATPWGRIVHRVPSAEILAAVEVGA